MSETPTPAIDPLWNLAVQRSIVDAEYRTKLLNAPREALSEIGIETGNLKLVVEEFSDNTRILVLPPPLFRAEGPEKDTSGKGSPSTPEVSPLSGLAMCALSEPEDSRVVYGQGTGRE